MRTRIWAAVTLAMFMTGCQQVTARLPGADPADPAAEVGATGYRSTIEPYTSLRPVTPTDWRNRNAPAGGDAR